METNKINDTIFVGNNSWNDFNKFKGNYGKLMVIVDRKVNEIYSDKISHLLKDSTYLEVVYGDMEDMKDISSVHELTQKALDFNLTRYDAVLSIGGGATGDLAGFFSSIYKRGIDFYNFPTTLMSQVDSSIGGKTAINFSGVKNVLGSFHLAKAIFIDPRLLFTLDDNEFTGGLGEIAKYALLDKDFFENTKDIIMKPSDLKDNPDLLSNLISQSVKTKLAYTENDLLDTLGKRIALNLGHTLAHLIENKEPNKLNHGQSVIIGLGFALFIARSLNLLNENDYNERKEMLCPLIYHIKGFDMSNYIEAFNMLNTDKKFKENKIQFVVPKADGFVVEHISQDEFKKYILRYSGDFN